MNEIINTYDQLMAAVAAKLLPKKHALAICAHHGGARSDYVNGVNVYSPFFKTGPDEHWTHHGCKWFHQPWGSSLPHTARQRLAEAEAIAWVAKTYGYTGPWVGNAWHNKVPEIVQKNFPIRQRKTPA